MSQLLLHITGEGIHIATTSAYGRKQIQEGTCEEGNKCWNKWSKPMSIEKVISKIKKIHKKEEKL